MIAQRVRMQQLVATTPYESYDLTRRYGSVQAYFDAYAPSPSQWQFYKNLFRRYCWGSVRPFDKLAFALLAWPWLTALALMVFRISMRRARIRPVHVMRCVLYGADHAFWAGLLIAPFVAVLFYQGGDLIGGRFPDLTAPPVFLALEPDQATAVAYVTCVVAVLFLTYRLIVAFRHYLRFDRPVATVLASQVIVFLVVWIVLTNWGISL
jgi:hypothetical protein